MIIALTFAVFATEQWMFWIAGSMFGSFTWFNVGNF